MFFVYHIFMKLPEWMHLGCMCSRLCPHPRAIYTAEPENEVALDK